MIFSAFDPLKESWRHQFFLINGNITDFCAIGEIYVHTMRQFQSNHCSLVKLLSDGLKIDIDRMLLPTGDKE